MDGALLELGLCFCRQGADEYARQSETAKLRQERILLLLAINEGTLVLALDCSGLVD